MTATDRSMPRRLAWGFLCAVTLAVIAAGAYSVIRGGIDAKSGTSGGRAPDLPVLFDTPEFKLTERSGQSLSSADLKGLVWIADFVFTNCAGPCPLMSQKMAELHEAFKHEPRLRFVTFTVDPARDTPQVLASYAEAYNADPGRWLFLTGDERELRDLIRKRFLVSVETASQPGADDGAILHATYFLLVDGKGRVRGIYESTDPERIAQLPADIRRLLAAERS